MKLDHIAYRVADRHDAARLMIEQFGYIIIDEFLIDFDDGSRSASFALQKDGEPDIFISDGSDEGIVYNWVKNRGGGGGVHHLAYFVDNVAAKMEEWKQKGVATFTTEEPIVGPGLTQAFTTPHPLTGTIYELINRDEGTIGFNIDSVRRLMESTKGL